MRRTPTVIEYVIGSKGCITGPMHVVSHDSALQLRRRLRTTDVGGEPGTNSAGAFLTPAPVFPGLAMATCPPASNPPQGIVSLMRANLLTTPVDVLVTMPQQRNTQAARRMDKIPYRTHQWSGPVPSGSIDELVFSRERLGGIPLMPDEGPASGVPFKTMLFCSSKPMIFAQLSRTLDTIALVELACELCGEYTLAPWTEQGFKNHPKDLSIANLRSFLAQMGWDARHHGRATSAARLAQEGSRSPLETIVFMLLCLPARLGGYGIPNPLLNPWVNAEGNVVVGRDEGGDLRPDLFWESARLDVEVQSRAFHRDKSTRGSRKMNDFDRELRLKTRGIEVLPVTITTIRSLHDMDALALHILRRLGRQSRYPTGDIWRARQAELRVRVVPGM